MAQPEAGLIVITKGKRGATSRTATVIHPGEGWVAFNQREAPCLRDIVHHPPREPIVLKAPRSRDPKQRQRAATWLTYTDTVETIARRAQVERLNAALGAADLAIDASALPSDLRGQIAIDLGDRYVSRYFNNARWDHGGRLFGGCWQTMPSAQRSALRTSGEPIAIVDYGSMFIRLLYVRCGLDVDPSLDLYRVPGFEGYREGIKKIMAALLFREGRLERLPQGSRPLLPRGTKAAEVEDAVRRAHPGIEQQLGCGAVGFGLMFTESQILLAVLDACLEAGIVALPLHDAVAVPLSQAVRVQGIMEAVYRQATGMSPAVGVKSASTAPDSLSDPDEADEA